jgi:hypothetical protein
MDRMRSRMAASSVEADLSDPNPERTVRERSKPVETPPAPKKELETTTATPAEEADALEGDGVPPKEPAEKPEAAPKKEPEDDKLPPEARGKDGKLAGPWKLVKQYETKLREATSRLVELEAKVPDAAKAEAAAKRLEAAEKRAAELEDHMRFLDYSKSEEFRTKYQQPYEEAWQKATGELAELQVLNEDGSVARQATAQDLLALANMPLGEARKMANQMFGDAADDVMAHRRRVRDLSDAQSKALEDARKNGGERLAKTKADHEARQAEVAKLWKEFSSADAEKYDFLKPKPEDDEWNERLTKANSLVDRAFAENPHDPKLTPEQRAQVVRRHAAVRSRAIAYSGLKLENSRLRAQLAAKEKELAQFSASAPTNGNGGGKSNEVAPAATPMERARQRLMADAVAAPPNYF